MSRGVGSLKVLLAIAGAAALPSVSAAGDLSTLALRSGERIHGRVVDMDSEGITVMSPLLGPVRIARSDLADVPGQPAGEAAAAPSTPADPPTFFRGWKWNAEFGLNGSSGNTETLNFRAGLNGKRETSKYDTTLGLTYAYGSEDGNKSKDRFEATARNDWKLDAPWRLFAQGKLESDYFQDWDWRWSAYAGVGYEFIKSDKTTLMGRAGAGASQEIGGSENKIVPEALLGLDYTHKFNERNDIFANIDFYPALDRFGPYRFNTKAGWQILVDEKSNMSLKLGVEDRYDSTPEGRRRNDVDYFVLLVFSF